MGQIGKERDAVQLPAVAIPVGVLVIRLMADVNYTEVVQRAQEQSRALLDLLLLIPNMENFRRLSVKKLANLLSRDGNCGQN